MKKAITAFFLIILMFLLQNSVFSQLAFGRSVPNLLIALTSIYGLMRGEYYGIWVGFFCGLLQDIFFMDVLGFYALVYMMIGYFNGRCSLYFAQDDFKLPLLCVSVSLVILLFVDYIFFYLLNGRFDFGKYFTGVMLPEIVYTLLLSAILYPLLLLLERKFVLAEKKKDDTDVL